MPIQHKKTLTRRNFTALGAVATLGLTTQADNGNAPLQPEGIIYNPTTPSKVADYAYSIFSEGGCMYAAAKSIISMTSTQNATVHYDIFKYGRGGCGGQGSLCGACNGAAAAIGFYVHDKKECATLTAKVFHWYKTTNLPLYKPAGTDKSFGTSISGSELCHISKEKWSKATGKSLKSPDRKKRCMYLTADTAAKTVTILNEYFSGKI